MSSTLEIIVLLKKYKVLKPFRLWKSTPSSSSRSEEYCILRALPEVFVLYNLPAYDILCLVIEYGSTYIHQRLMVSERSRLSKLYSLVALGS
ncbi:hypothetical protein J6590_032486 [Homalodisca vitripennis]|nr:hypothetical protein J6590_032486 [Homalodisca vitripennis]